MRKGLILTDRDYLIMSHLAIGLTTARYIFEHFFANDGRNEKTRKRVMQRRLKKLLKERLIQARYSPSIASVLYALTEKGSQYVSDRSGKELSNIWYHFPKNEDLFHDLLVSAVAKKISKDDGQIPGYTLESLRFEKFLKSFHKGKKGIYYPDIEIAIETNPGLRFFKFDIEIDCGTISRKAFIGKINSSDGTILFVVNKKERLNLLFGYLKWMYIPGKYISFTTTNEFLQNGLLKCKWYSPNFPEGKNLLTPEQIMEPQKKPEDE